MQTPAIAVLLLALASSPRAITWEFEEDTQGWQIRLRSDSGDFLPPLDAVVEEGLLRIPITEQFLGFLRHPVLISPKLDLDSGLFDRVEIRLRFVHPDPVAGGAALAWVNDGNEDAITSHWELPAIFEPAVFTSEWQDVVFHPLDAEESWEGMLKEIWLTVVLFEGTPEHPAPTDLSELPEWVEIDRIVLTGTEERLQGELPPPEVPVRDAPGLLFEKAQFVPMGQEGLGYVITSGFPRSGSPTWTGMATSMCWCPGVACGRTGEGW